MKITLLIMLGFVVGVCSGHVKCPIDEPACLVGSLLEELAGALARAYLRVTFTACRAA